MVDHQEITDLIKSETDISSFNFNILDSTPGVITVRSSTKKYDEKLDRKIRTVNIQNINVPLELKSKISCSISKTKQNIKTNEMKVIEEGIKGNKRYLEYYIRISKKEETEIPDFIKNEVRKNIMDKEREKIEKIRVIQQGNMYKLEATIKTDNPEEWYGISRDEFVSKHPLFDINERIDIGSHPITFTITLDKNIREKIEEILFNDIHSNIEADINHSFGLDGLTYTRGNKIIEGTIFLTPL